MTKYLHKKRGSIHTLIDDRVFVQSKFPIFEGDMMCVYMTEDGQMWVRPYKEFFDGRFEVIND